MWAGPEIPDGAALGDLQNIMRTITALVEYCNATHYAHAFTIKPPARRSCTISLCVGIIFRSPIRGGRRRSSCLYWLSRCLRARSLFSPTLSLGSLSLARSLTSSLSLSPPSPPSTHAYSRSPLHRVSSLVYRDRTRKTLFWDTLDVRVTKSFFFTAYLYGIMVRA